MDLNEIVVFAKVVGAGSFTSAARELGMPKLTVSRKVSDLEERLGARLLQRTTRKLSLTDVGNTYYQYARRVVDEVEEAELAVTRMQEAPRGLLRITTPLTFRYMGPIVSSFLERYPDVRVEMVGTDRVVNLVDEGFDLAVRAGRLADSSLIARSLGAERNVLVASPAFLEAHGVPESPAALAEIDCIAFGGSSAPTTWTLTAGGESVSVTVPARLVVNDFEIVRVAALAGRGMAMVPLSLSCEDLRAGRLVRVLTDWCSPDVPIHAVYPSTRHLSPKVSAFLDHLQAAMNPPPWERVV